MHAYRWMGPVNKTTTRAGSSSERCWGFLFSFGREGISGLFFPFVGIKGQHARGPGDFSSCLGGVFLGFVFFPFHHITLQLLGFLFTLGLDYGSLDTPIGLGREEEYLSNNSKGENIKVGRSLPT
jgi:hypothetical protein